jgi:hypothetical protein
VTDAPHPERVARLTATPPLPQDLVDAILDSSDAERAEAVAELFRRMVMALDFRAAAAISAAFGTICGTWAQPAYATRPMSDVVKVVSAKEADWIDGVIRWGAPQPPE